VINLRANSPWAYPQMKTRDFEDVYRARDAEGKAFRWSRGRRFHSTHGSEEFGGGVKDCVYLVNSDIHHGPEHYYGPDVVTLGCSFTGGMGLPHNFSWPHLIESVTGARVNNLGRPGSSIESQVYRFFTHIVKYGNPKKVLFLAPDIFRAQILETKRWTEKTLFFDDELNTYVDTDYRPYVHTNFNGEQSLVPVDVMINVNLKALEVLQMFCEAQNIDITVFSWEDTTLQILKSCQYPNLAAIPNHLSGAKLQATKEEDSQRLWWKFPEQISSIGISGCCDLHPNGYWQTKAWTVALDRTDKWKRPHPGLHSQIHFAEIMSGLRITNEMIKEIRPWHEGTALEPERG